MSELEQPVSACVIIIGAMTNVAKVLILTAGLLSAPAAWAADPTGSVQPDPTGSGPAGAKAAAPAPDGAQLFATNCASCHKSANLAKRLQSAADPKAAREKMAAFVPHHRKIGADASAAIIDYLASSKAP
jgi:mono/diheme cytochrome c family protein